MNVALYFGSFNPMHTGHLAICRYLAGCNILDEVRLVVSPANPLKSKLNGINSQERLEHVRNVVSKLRESQGNNLNITVSDIEFTLPEPLYTIETMRTFTRMEPENRFILVIGADNLAIIEKWHRWQDLLDEYEIWVYPRKGYDLKGLCAKYDTIPIEASMVDISSSEIRDGEANGLEMSDFKV